MLTLFWRKVFSLYLTFIFTNTVTSWKIAGVGSENSIVERKNRQASSVNIAVRSENTIPNPKSENVEIIIPRFDLRSSNYILSFQLNLGSTATSDLLDKIENAIEINVLPGDFWKSGKLNRTGNYGLMEGKFLT